jgi:hypothetical protein
MEVMTMTRKKIAKPRRATARTPAAHFPKGWDQKRADEVAKYYDNQSDEDAIAEAEAAYQSTNVTMMAIPVELVPQVQKLIAKRAG